MYRGDSRAGAFERCTVGLPGWFDDNIDTYCLDSLNDGSFAAFGTSDGRLFGSEDTGSTWHELAPISPRSSMSSCCPVSQSECRVAPSGKGLQLGGLRPTASGLAHSRSRSIEP